MNTDTNGEMFINASIGEVLMEFPEIVPLIALLIAVPLAFRCTVQHLTAKNYEQRTERDEQRKENDEQRKQLRPQLAWFEEKRKGVCFRSNEYNWLFCICLVPLLDCYFACGLRFKNK